MVMEYEVRCGAGQSGEWSFLRTQSFRGERQSASAGRSSCTAGRPAAKEKLWPGKLAQLASAVVSVHHVNLHELWHTEC